MTRVLLSPLTASALAVSWRPASADEPWVALSVSEDGRVPADLSAVSCPAMARIDMLRVRLSAPIAGRAPIGQSLGTATVGLTGRRTVPRVVGLRAEDARFSLRAQGFRVGDRLGGRGVRTAAGPAGPGEDGADHRDALHAVLLTALPSPISKPAMHAPHTRTAETR